MYEQIEQAVDMREYLAVLRSRKWTVLLLTGFIIALVLLGVRQDIRREELGLVDSPVTFGEAGLVVFPHLLALHGLLVLAVLAWLLSFTARSEERRTRVVQIALAGYVVLIAVSLAQALAGRAPFELLAPAALVFWTSMAIFVAAFAATLV